ncbi:hypothetical protein SESBI_01827 [Sesbania bispinosa]|nr:hypothetical protein SESBI_01827 [Sesbania bispinosa]
MQIHGLPLDTLSTKNVAKIVGKFGEVLEEENPMVEGKLLRTFIKVRMLIDLRRPLSTGCWIPSPEQRVTEGPTLSLEDISMCRSQLRGFANPVYNSPTLLRDQPKHHNDTPTLPIYFVEFPPEENPSEPHNTPDGPHIHWQEKKQLILGMNTTLSLKRNREELEPFLIILHEKSTPHMLGTKREDKEMHPYSQKLAQQNLQKVRCGD